ncbi:hypothetical protein [Saccharothrix sp. HUAS TT1]|uniref:hypothetical protein n=1 Tax=unclassified Saccharothrix TaxID=2593673 RepID=UPI00345B76D9
MIFREGEYVSIAGAGRCEVLAASGAGIGEYSFRESAVLLTPTGEVVYGHERGTEASYWGLDLTASGLKPIANWRQVAQWARAHLSPEQVLTFEARLVELGFLPSTPGGASQ